MSVDGTYSKNDELLLVFAAAFLAPVLLSAAVWSRLSGWLVGKGVLVSEASQPVVALPACGGAGLDGPRLAVTVGVLLMALAIAVTVVRRWTARRVAKVASR
jgi:hypothetical protein